MSDSKLKEFVEKVNEHDGMRAKKTDEGIVIGTPRNNGIFIIPEDATNFLEIENWTVSNRAYWKKPDREYLSALIEELLHTPIKERFPEKKWHLCIGQDEYGNDIYLMNVVGSTKQLRTSVKAENSLSTFTDSDLVRLKEQYPRLAPAIEAMKEPVEE